MVKLPQKQTTYADYLYSKMEQLLIERGGFTMQQLADFAGLKVTGNMRRRVQHCVVVGTLAVGMYYGREANRGLVFFKPQEVDPTELPF